MATTTTELQTLDINLLSKEQYDALVEAGTINENALYLTPEEAGSAGSYSDLTNKPSINGVTLSGNKTSSELGINSAVWGNISGTLSNQTDLNTALNSKLEGVSVNGTALPVSNKSVNVTVPTKVSDLTNDSGYITDAGVTSFNGSTGAITYTAPVASVNGQTGAVVLNIPTIPSSGTTATAVSTTSSGGTAATWSKSDHVHSISSSTIVTALGYTPGTGSGSVTSVTAGAGLNTTSDDTATDGGSITSSGTLNLTKTAVTAGSYGPSSNSSPDHGDTISVPYVTVDKYGRVTGASTKIITLPASGNTDASVEQKAAITTNGAYPIILANGTGTTAVTGSVNKSSTLTYNPSTKALVTGGTVDGYTLADASAKGVDTTIAAASTSTNLPTSAAVASFVEGKGYTSNTGTVTSVRVQASSPIESSTSTAQTGSLDTTISHATSGVTAGTYGSATSVPVFSVNATGHVTGVTNTNISVTADTKYTTCTLPIFSEAGSQAVTVSGVTVNSHPVLDVYIDTIAHATAYKEAWSHIYRADTSADTITFYSDAATSTALTVMVKDY